MATPLTPRPMAPSTLKRLCCLRACWVCGATSEALRQRSKGYKLLLALPAAGQLVLAQGAAALARLATHALDGLCNNCWVNGFLHALQARAPRQDGGAGAGSQAPEALRGAGPAPPGVGPSRAPVPPAPWGVMPPGTCLLPPPRRAW
jgi:hypothetical protein